jgi:hypothetical protein
MAARIVGSLMLATGLWQAYKTGHWSLSAISMGLTFLIGSFVQPERRY